MQDRAPVMHASNEIHNSQGSLCGDQSAETLKRKSITHRSRRTHDQPIQHDDCSRHGDQLLGGGSGVYVGAVQVVCDQRADCNLLCGAG